MEKIIMIETDWYAFDLNKCREQEEGYYIADERIVRGIWGDIPFMYTEKSYKDNIFAKSEIKRMRKINPNLRTRKEAKELNERLQKLKKILKRKGHEMNFDNMDLVEDTKTKIDRIEKEALYGKYNKWSFISNIFAILCIFSFLYSIYCAMAYDSCLWFGILIAWVALMFPLGMSAVRAETETRRLKGKILQGE